MRYAEARLIEYQREQAYRSYVAKSLQLIPQDKYIMSTFDEVLNPKPVDTRTGDEIALDVIAKAGLHFGDKSYGNDSV